VVDKKYNQRSLNQQRHRDGNVDGKKIRGNSYPPHQVDDGMSEELKPREGTKQTKENPRRTFFTFRPPRQQ